VQKVEEEGGGGEEEGQILQGGAVFAGAELAEERVRSETRRNKVSVTSRAVRGRQRTRKRGRGRRG
jgi:hypothetical protein